MTKYRVWNANASESDIVCASPERAVEIFIGLHPEERGNAVRVNIMEARRAAQ